MKTTKQQKKLINTIDNIIFEDNLFEVGYGMNNIAKEVWKRIKLRIKEK